MAEIPAHVPLAATPHPAPVSGPAYWVRRVAWPLAIALLIFCASSRSHVASPGFTRVDDKFAHFGSYGLLGTLVCRIRGGGWRAAGVSLLVVSAYGASDEWHQSFVPGRASDSADWVADTLGAALAIGLYTQWGWYRRLLETPVWFRRPAGAR